MQAQSTINNPTSVTHNNYAALLESLAIDVDTSNVVSGYDDPETDPRCNRSDMINLLKHSIDFSISNLNISIKNHNNEMIERYKNAIARTVRVIEILNDEIASGLR